MVAKAIELKLQNFRQWSDISEGYATSDELIADCTLDPEGHVTTPEKVTELVAESYVAAAQIYHMCRLLRCVLVLPSHKRWSYSTVSC